MRRPEAFTFFVDRALGRIIVPSALRAAGVPVEIHDDHFAPDAPDELWLREVGKRGWVVLTKDKKFRHRIPEISAIARANVRVFNLTAGQLRAAEMGEIFVGAIDKIRRFSLGNPPPFLARVTRSGYIHMALSWNQLRRYR